MKVILRTNRINYAHKTNNKLTDEQMQTDKKKRHSNQNTRHNKHFLYKRKKHSNNTDDIGSSNTYYTGSRKQMSEMEKFDS